jgi:hypothetical protein
LIRSFDLLKAASAAYHGNSPTMKKLSLVVIASLALLATLPAEVRLPQATRGMSLMAFGEAQSAAKQLPAGFVLPSSDADLRISSLVEADLDADGDLDIVASAAWNGSPDIVVWVNEGDGRLTRKRPEQPKTLGAESPAPSVDRQSSTAVALIQTGSPALHADCVTAWLTLDAGRCSIPGPAAEVSATVATRRSRAPPVLA